MKKVVSFVLAFTILALSASAQHKAFKKQGRHRQDIAQKLNFTEAQRDQAKSIRKEYQTRMQALNKNENMTVKEYRIQKATLAKEQKASMQALYTPEQREQLAKLKTEGKARREASQAKRMDKMKAKLQLSDDQMAKMKANRESLKGKLQAIKANEGLSKEQRKEQFMALRNEYKSNFERILTAEQKEKIKTLKHKRPAKMEAK